MNSTFQPTAVKDRIELLDVLRGFSIAGVLIVNLLYFSGYIYTPFTNLETMHLPALNATLITVLFSAFLGKFYPILCMLFGMGVYMQFTKSQQPGFLKFFIKRMLLLLLIGILHSLIWPGDVVTVYALFAFLLLPLRRLSPKSFLYLAVLMFVLNFVAIYLTPILFPQEPQEYTAYIHLADYTPKEVIRMVQEDGWQGFSTLVKTHLQVLWTIERYVSLSFRVLLLMMTGAFLYGSGFLLNKMHKKGFLLLFLSIGIIGALLINFVSWSFRIIDNLFLALAYMSAIALLLKTTFGQKLLRPLVPLGRTALSAYLIQTLFGIILFYGIGFGLYGKLPLYAIVLISLAFLQIQIFLAKFWLKNHNYGPAEYIWRKLTYHNK